MSGDHFKQSDVTRRRFLKGAVMAAFAAPVVVSFALDGIAEADPRHLYPNQTYGNQPRPIPEPGEHCQTFPNQIFPNQTFPNQIFPNQTFPNQIFPNQPHLHHGEDDCRGDR